MKTPLIAFLIMWLALPHSQSAAEIKVLQSACQTCGGDVHYVEGADTGECEDCGDKMALMLLVIGGCLCLIGAGCWTAHKLKKLGGTNGVLSVSNRFRGELTQALFDNSISGMSVVRSSDTNDVPWLLSMNSATNSSGRYVLESSTNMIDWTELGRYADEDFLAVNPATEAACFYRVRVNP